MHPLMIAQVWGENTREITNYGGFIYQFLSDIMKSIQQLERTNKKICKQNNVYNFHSSIYIYIYIVLFGPVKPELGVILQDKKIIQDLNI